MDTPIRTLLSPTAPRKPMLSQTQNYELYTDAVLVGAAEFIQISPEFFVVQGWDARINSSTVRKFTFKDSRPGLYYLYRMSGIIYNGLK